MCRDMSISRRDQKFIRTINVFTLREQTHGAPCPAALLLISFWNPLSVCHTRGAFGLLFGDFERSDTDRNRTQFVIRDFCSVSMRHCRRSVRNLIRFASGVLFLTSDSLHLAGTFEIRGSSKCPRPCNFEMLRELSRSNIGNLNCSPIFRTVVCPSSPSPCSPFECHPLSYTWSHATQTSVLEPLFDR